MENYYADTVKCGAKSRLLTHLTLFSSCTASACVEVHRSIGAILGIWQSEGLMREVVWFMQKNSDTVNASAVSSN